MEGQGPQAPGFLNDVSHLEGSRWIKPLMKYPDPLVMTYIAIENCPFIVDLPIIYLSIDGDFP